MRPRRGFSLFPVHDEDLIPHFLCAVMPALRRAIIICTRNRPEELRRTVASIEEQDQASSLLLMVVDASAPEQARRTQALLDRTTLPNCYVPYPATPSLARQRNYGLDRLPASVDIVFFLDDDVTLLPGFFHRVTDYMDRHSDVVGVGGLNTVELPRSASPVRRGLRHAFLLDHPRPGRVLPSGAASSPHHTSHAHPTATQWLTGFAMAYRRSALERERFDERLEGYSHYEDRDLSVRIRRHGRLVMLPQARLIHRESPTNRYDAASFTYSMITHLYWFVEKDIRHPLRKPAFWWATLGRFLATLTSSKPQKWAALHGQLSGIRAILTRAHPLLRTPS